MFGSFALFVDRRNLHHMRQECEREVNVLQRPLETFVARFGVWQKGRPIVGHGRFPPMPATASVDLDLRRVPVQKRGRRTFEAILDAAAQCLQDQGVGNLSTNMIAERAGVNIATLYSYFPNKESILREMLARSEEARLAALVPAIDGLDGDGWREAVGEMIGAMARVLVDSPVTLELRRAVAATPELRPLAREGDGAIAFAVAEKINGRNPHLEPDHARTVAEVAVLGASGVLDVQCDGSRIDQAVLDQLSGMVTACLAPAVDGA